MSEKFWIKIQKFEKNFQKTLVLKNFSASYFDEISKDTGKYCFIQDTISALEQGAVEKLIIWEHLDVKRYVMRNPTTEGEVRFFLFFSKFKFTYKSF